MTFVVVGMNVDQNTTSTTTGNFRSRTAVTSKSKSSEAEMKWHQLIEISRVHDHEKWTMFSGLFVCNFKSHVTDDDSTFELNTELPLRLNSFIYFGSSILLHRVLVYTVHDINDNQASDEIFISCFYIFLQYGFDKYWFRICVSTRSADLFGYLIMMKHEINVKSSFKFWKWAR